ncbi:MAG: ABC transporter substrate-binding protein, partial [Alphaproteobacteria bacterium]|nr:ABC transporter substrate-binding protein [Alphaproteobacteria bacterium]
ESLSPETRQETFRELLSEGFDMPRVARFVLGRYWRRATEAQRDEYLRLFEDYIVGSYGARLSAYGGETLRIADSRPDGAGYAVVRSQIVRPEGPPIAINWRLYEGEFGWRIVDVVVEGVSLSLVQRSEFTSVIRSGGGNIEALLGALRKKRGLMESGLADTGRSAG